MAVYDPNATPTGQPPDQPPPDVPPPAPGPQETPQDNINGPMAGGMQQASPEEQAQADHFVALAMQLIYDDSMFPTVLKMLTGGAGPGTPPPGAAGPQGAPPGAGAPPEAGVPPDTGAPDEGAAEQAGEPAGPAGETPEEQAPEMGGGAPPEAGPTINAQGDPIKGLAQTTDLIVARVGDLAAQGGESLIPDAVYHAAGDIFEDLAELSRRAMIKDYTQDRKGLESAWYQALDLYRQRLQSGNAIDTQHAKGDLQKLVQADQNGTLEKIMRDLAASDEAGPAGGPPVPPQEAAQGRRPRGFNAAMGA